MIRPAPPVLLPLVLACGGGDPPPAPAPQPAAAPSQPVQAARKEGPNVLFLVWDTVRADHMSLYGYGRPTTPKLDAWARDATVYERAWSPATWTVPSHGSMFTGLAVTSHGAQADHRWLDDGHQTLAELLAADGYDTVALSANLYVGSFANLLQGFGTVHTSYPRKTDPRGRYVQAANDATRAKLIPEDASTEMSPAFRGVGVELWDKAGFKDAAPVLSQGLFDWLDERGGDRPWMAYVNFMEAHTPRIPSAASREAVMDAEMRALALKTDTSLFAENAWMIGEHTYSDAEMAAINGVYDATLRDLDDATAALFAGLAKRGQLDNTIVVLVADHGESLGEHGRLEHRWAIHEPLIHVPLVVRWPNHYGAGRVTTPVNTVDLFATILDATGTAPPKLAGLQSRPLRELEGRGLVYSQLRNAFANQLRAVHERWPHKDLSEWKATYAAVRDGDLKFVRRSDGVTALYDLAVDPGELSDLQDIRIEETVRLEEALNAWEAGLPPYKVMVPRTKQTHTAEERAQLEALGYIEDEEGDQGEDEDAP